MKPIHAEHHFNHAAPFGNTYDEAVREDGFKLDEDLWSHFGRFMPGVALPALPQGRGAAQELGKRRTWEGIVFHRSAEHGIAKEAPKQRFSLPLPFSLLSPLSHYARGDRSPSVKPFGRRRTAREQEVNMYYSTILITSLLSCADPHASSSLAAKRFFRSRSFFFSPSTCGRRWG